MSSLIQELKADETLITEVYTEAEQILLSENNHQALQKLKEMKNQEQKQ